MKIKKKWLEITNKLSKTVHLSNLNIMLSNVIKNQNKTPKI